MLELLLSRLEGAKRNGKGYVARCPAHEDRDPSLSIRECDDGRVLLHCHAGCPTPAVVAALGLAMADLFPPGDKPRRPAPVPGVSRKDLQDAVEFEKSILAIIKADASKGKPISKEDFQRGQLARKRIALAKVVLHA